MLKYFFTIITIIFLFQGIAFADYYKWEDESSVTHITDYPPPQTSSTKKVQVHKIESETNNNSTFINKDEQKASKSTKSLTNAQPTGSPSNQPIGPQEQNPPPYNCVKLCLQDNRNAIKACREDREKYHTCMKQHHEQMNNCRKKCREEENYIESNHDVEKNNVKTSNSHEAFAEASTSLLHTVKFDLVDQRDPAEREGYPYPKSWFSYVMHGDQSLNVDRLSILKTKLIERFGSKLEGKIIILMKFYVMEATVGPKVPPAKETDKGPYLPTLISEISMKLDGNYFSGEAFFRLRQGSRSTKSALTLATTMAVDDLLKDIERRWKGNINFD